MTELRSRLLCEMTADLETHPIGPTPGGMRLVAAVTGGTLTGDRLSGRVLPFGGDFALTTADGCLHIDVRAGFETHDGARIYATYGGRLMVPPEHAAALADPRLRDSLDPSKYYFRTAPLFETGDERYAWLNRILAVGMGRLTATGVAYRIFEIL